MEAGYSREVRIGLVLYGGVSLAVYENGVAQEFCRAIRGEGIYALLKDLTDSDIVVDVISGTSAGGVNGVMLGYALANDLDFTSVAGLWRDEGDIARLLRTKDDPETKSLLDSEGYYQKQLAAALQRLPKWTPREGSIPSTVTELDLFATGTDVEGSVRTVFDDAGHAIDVKNHRAVFKLEFRGSRKNDFDPKAVTELATLARLTSCFPLAFAPVEVSTTDHPYLTRWGQLTEPAVFLDGGILDNKPFSYAVDTIFSRKADRDVQRLLFYVEPNPERFMPAGKVIVPGALSAAMKALVGIPGYESIAADLESIAEHNEVVCRLEGLIRATVPTSRGAGFLEETKSTLAGVSEDSHVYKASRLTQLRNRAVEGILNEGKRRPFFLKTEERRAARIVVDSFAEWKGSYVETLDQFDVFFRIRRLYHLTYALRSFLYDHERPSPEVAERYRRLWRDINHFIQLLEVAQSQMEALVDQSHIEWKFLHEQFKEHGNEVEPSKADLATVSERLWGQIALALTALLTNDSITDDMIRDTTQETSCYTAMVSRRQVVVNAGSTPGTSANLLQRIDTAVRSLLRDFTRDIGSDQIAALYSGFVDIDRQVFPLQYAAGTHTRDIIQVVRLSPADAQRGLSARGIEEKICGRALGAFGGFFKKPWRSNDIMWGRIDALCQIVECTFTKERIRKVPRSAPSQQVLEARLAAMFKSTDAPTITRLAQQLWNVHALNDAGFEGLLSALIEAGQLEIAEVEWRQVIDDALEQERLWGHHGVLTTPLAGTPPFSSERVAWEAAVQGHDGLIVALAAQAAAKPQLDLFKRYRVAGRPFVEEIPKPVLLELGTLALMRFERSVASELPAWQSLGTRVFYKTFFSWILPTLYGWARFSRTAPEYGRSLTASLLVASLFAFLFGVAFLTIGVSVTTAQWMVAVSVMVMAVWVLVFRRE